MNPVSTPEDIADLPEKAVQLAAEVLKASRNYESSSDRAHSGKMARMMADEAGKKFTIAMADQVLRMHRPARSAKRLQSLLQEYGLPKYLSWFERCLLWVGNKVAQVMPGWVMPLVKKKVRTDSAHVIISAEPNQFPTYLAKRAEDQIRINFNQLGEAVLGDREADHRLELYLKRLREPGINYCSVKLSSMLSQISLTGYENTLVETKERLRQIYRAAIQGGDTAGPKFVNLDMEEYRDLHMTVDVFQAVLDEPEFEKLDAGIVLQAYLPDSFKVMQSLTEWAKKRYERTQAGIKIRLVKGANLAMEQVEASLEDWPQAPYRSKTESDANYKRMLEFGCRPENAKVVRLGIASHNLFDIAYALLLRERRGVAEFTEFEMLEGMANGQALEIRERTGNLVVYSPVCYDAEFESAIAYLVRRFDENTSPGSFLGALFALQEGTPAWNEQRDAFLAACRLAHDPTLSAEPNRTQNRATEEIDAVSATEPFHNAANTDFSLPANRTWIQEIVQDWQTRTIDPIPLQVGGEIRTTDDQLPAHDPSRPNTVAYKYSIGDRQDVERAFQCAEEAQKDWEALGVAKRGEILRQVAVEIARGRGDVIGTMMLDAGKAIIESDVEITEAVDFANYYAQSLDDPCWTDGTELRAAGVVVVTPPWNFPYAIPAGGCLAALMAGNAVILKPAPESVLTAWTMVQQLWAAGVPKSVLQFLPLQDGETGKALISDPRAAIVILTGAYSTAELFQSWRPEMRLYAETSGKNAMIISAAADLDLAVKDLVHGAFGHAGQKCSATSLALVQREVYESKKFLNQLKDAAQSLKVAGSWNPSAKLTPVIREPGDELKQGLTTLEPGESWLLKPQMIDDNPCLWSPGIKLGVKRGSWYHRTECFGPVLGLICVDSFEEALEIQNDNAFGLTGGLYSLDPQEIERWRDGVEVGNAYINRSTTGAIVQRQPFGGWKNSCVGPGAKAGGPNYVSSLGEWMETGMPAKSAAASRWQEVCQRLGQMVDEVNVETLQEISANYQQWWDSYFVKEHDPSHLHGETNHFRYRVRDWHLVRVQENTNARQALARVALASLVTGVKIELSPRSRRRLDPAIG